MTYHASFSGAFPGSTVTLLHFDGQDGSINFPDQFNTIWARVGDTQIDTAQSVFGGASAYFDGSVDCLKTDSAIGTGLDFGTGDFTIDFWTRMPTAGTGVRMVFAGSGAGEIQFGFDTTNLGIGVYGVGWDMTRAHGIADNTWAHVAITRHGTDLRMFVNGAQLGAAATISTDYNVSGGQAFIGAIGGINTFYGWIDELRILKGEAAWIAPFTVPSAPYVAGIEALLRADGNASVLYAIFDIPVPVFVARINQTFPTHDMVAQLVYDTVSTGAVTDALYGMTVLISTALPATPANTVGITYIRKAASASPIYTGETSEIPYVDDLYITVLDEFGIWQDHIRVQETGAAFIRYDTAYSDQHTNFDPTPIVGSDRAARLPPGGSVTLLFLAADYVIDGSAIASRVSVFTGAASTAGLTSATPTATYDTTGRYKWKYTVTAANGKSRTTWRDIYIYDDTHLITIDPILNSFSQDWDTGGAEFNLTVLQDATTSAIRDRTKVVLIEEASYGGAAGSLGVLAGAENIVGIGWLDDETITLDKLRGEITLTAKTAHYWLDKESAFVVGYQNTTGTPAAWTSIKNLTPDLAAWDAFTWRTTITNCVDVQFSGDTRQAIELVAPQGSLWSQITALMQETIFAHPCCDQYGRIFCEIDTALVPVAARVNYPMVANLTKDDYLDVNISRVTVTKTARVDLSGVVVTGDSGAALFSLSDGHVFDRYGSPEPLDQLLLSTQAQANQLAADYKAQRNKPYTFDISGATNNRLVGVCPHQFAVINIIASDTLRNIAYSGNIIIRRAEWSHDPVTGVWSTSWGADPETTGALSINGDIPVVDNTGLELDPWTPPSFPPLVIPPLTPPPPIATQAYNLLAVLFVDFGLFYVDTSDPSLTWRSINGALSAADLAALQTFSINKMGRVFFSRNNKIWSTVLGSNVQTVLGDQAFFSVLVPDAPAQNLGQGVDRNIDNTFITWINGNSSGSALYQMVSGALSGTVGTAVPNHGYILGNFVRYGTNWFWTYANSLDGAYYVKFPDPPNWGTASQVSFGTYGGGYLWAVHALDADYAYAASQTNFCRITSAGATATTLSEGAAQGPQQYACDPTGQYVFVDSYNGFVVTPKKSADYGATWAAIATFPPAGTIQPGTSRIINVGDANKWIWSYNDLADGYKYKIYATQDAGATWTSLLGNLVSLLPSQLVYSRVIGSTNG